MGIIEQTESTKIQGIVKPVVLLAEDEPSLLSILSKKISQLDCKLVTAEDGEDAFQKFEKHKPEVLVTDIIMPKMNGFDLVQKLRTKYQSSFKVIVLTNLNNPTDDEMAKSLNVDAFLLKSDISLRSIVQKVQELLEAPTTPIAETEK
jgi:CheY-like chemotaxis protein